MIKFKKYSELSIWEQRYLDDAKQKSYWSKDPSTKIGAIAVSNDKEPLSNGFNGFPRHIDDSTERYENREVKYKYIIHAEANLICNAARTQTSLKNSTVYVYGLLVCSSCACLLVQSGISKVYAIIDKEIPERWMESFELAASIFKEADVEYICVRKD